MLKKVISISALCFLTLTQSCLFTPKVTIKGGNLRLEQVDFENLEGWQYDNHKEALFSFIQSCNKFAQLPQSTSIGKQLGYVSAGDFRDVCEIANIVKTMNSRQAQNFFENWFKPFVVLKNNGSSRGIFTGYYEADLRGSRVKTDIFKYPIYAKPKDLGSSPYLTRKEIEEGALDNKGLELLYVDDKVELFFLHVQGSGRVSLPDGSRIKVAYAAKNNRDYSSIGGYMESHGLLPRGGVSADSIKEWMSKHPEEADDVMNSNAAFVFFQLSDDEYVVGAQNVPLTPERSLAVDSSIMPYGFPLWVSTTLKGKNGSKTPYNKLLVSQDTGSAIKGAVRGDIFFGFGEEAESKASYMASPGEYYILLPINVVDKMMGR
jgi:membrane-bound lytic murein transglycosylase A